MKVKTFFAPDIRQAIKMVREEQGPDAVIISNRRVDGGVEIVAATDYDEALLGQFQAANSAKGEAPKAPPAADKLRQYSENSPAKPAAERPASVANSWSGTRGEPSEQVLLEVRRELKTMRSFLETRMAEIAWGSFKQRSPMQAEILNRLLEFGLSHALSLSIAESVHPDQDIEAAWSECLQSLADEIPIASDDIFDKGGVVALVGPTGVGKTTSVAKIAARYVLRHGARRIALLTTDDYRVGAHEQLRNYGRLLNIPVRNASTADELQTQLDDLADKDLVLIDTAGVSQRDIRLSEQLALLKDGKSRIQIYLTLSANSQMRGMEETIAAFKKIRLDGCILTKIDETCSMGQALNAVINGNLPVIYVSDGQRVPEDLHLARSEKLVSQGVALMKQPINLSEEEMGYASVGRTLLNAH